MAAVLTHTGEEWVAHRLAEDANATYDVPMTHIGLGTGVTAEAKTQTALVTEITDGTPARGTVTISVTGSTDTAKYQAAGAAITADTTYAITEAGLFTASSAGVMSIRATFAAVNMSANDTLAVTFTIDPS